MSSLHIGSDKAATVHLCVLPSMANISAEQVQYWRSRLSMLDLIRFDKISSAPRAKQFVVGRAFLTAMIEKYLGLDIALSIADSGKPLLSFGACSVAHSGDAVAVALSTSENHSIGVDIERIKHRDYMAVVKSYFHINECKQFGGLTKVAQQRLFYSLWVQKEALAKYWGFSVLEMLHKDVAAERVNSKIVSYVGNNEEFFFSLATSCASLPILDAQQFCRSTQMFEKGVKELFFL